MSYHQLIIKNTIYEKRRIAKLGKTNLNVIGFGTVWLKLCDNMLSDNNMASELVENGSFLEPSQSRKL